MLGYNRVESVDSEGETYVSETMARWRQPRGQLGDRSLTSVTPLGDLPTGGLLILALDGVFLSSSIEHDVCESQSAACLNPRKSLSCSISRSSGFAFVNHLHQVPQSHLF